MHSKSQSRPRAASATAIAYSQKRSNDGKNSPLKRRGQTVNAPIAKRSARVGSRSGEIKAVAGCNCDRWGHPCPSCVERIASTGYRSFRFRRARRLAGTAFCNRCVDRLASSFNRRIFSIVAPFLAVGYGRRASSSRPRLAFAVHKLRGQQGQTHDTAD